MHTKTLIVAHNATLFARSPTAMFYLSISIPSDMHTSRHAGDFQVCLPQNAMLDFEALMLGISLKNWIFFLILYASDSATENLSAGLKTLLGAMQAVATLLAKFQTIPISSLAPAVQYDFVSKGYYEKAHFLSIGCSTLS